MISCPECYVEFPPSEAPVLHEILECAECRAELEIVSLSPLLVALAPEIEEDWGE